MATISVPAGGSIQAACNAAANGDVISLAAGATYYESVQKNGKVVDIQGNGACISGAMPEFLSPGMWTNAGTFVGTESGRSYTKWTAQYPATYPFSTNVQEYGSIRLAGPDDQLWWHYETLVELETNKIEPDGGRGYFVDVDGSICLVSPIDPNTIPLNVSRVRPPLEVTNGSIVNVYDLNVKYGGRYGIKATVASELNVYNTNTLNSGINIGYSNGSTGEIVDSTATSNYNADWAFDDTKFSRMEENNISINNSFVDIRNVDVYGSTNGIVVIGTSEVTIDNAMVTGALHDGYEFEDSSKSILKNSYGVDNWTAASLTPLNGTGYVYLYNNLFVSTKYDWVRSYDWTTNTATLWPGEIYKTYSTTQYTNQNVFVYNNTSYGPEGIDATSLNDGGFFPIENMEWKNNIFHATQGRLFANTGTEANGIQFDSNVFWSDAFNSQSYWYVGQDRPVSAAAGTPNASTNLAGQTLPATWTDNIEANPLFAAAGTNTVDRAALTAAYTVSDTSPACDMTLCPIPADWPCAVEANESTCAGLARVVEIVCLDPIISAVSNGQATIFNPNTTPLSVTITSGSATFQNPIPANTTVIVTNITGGDGVNAAGEAIKTFCISGNC